MVLQRRGESGFELARISPEVKIRFLDGTGGDECILYVASEGNFPPISFIQLYH